MSGADETGSGRRKSFSERKVENALRFAEERQRQRRRQERLSSAVSVVLRSQKGQRCGAGICHLCGTASSQRWRYADSSRGPLTICDRCKPGLFERSHQPVDALDHARRAGRFDGQRRR